MKIFKMTPFKKLNMKKPAFTMIELVMVIVVLGILASLAMPRLERDLRQEAADSILSNIRYTQHLALTDNKHMFNNAQWQQKWWRIVFSTCTGTDRFFMIGSDDAMAGGNEALFIQTEAASDPLTGNPLFWNNNTSCATGVDTSASSKDIFISKKYGITNIIAAGSCAATANTSGHIGFDNFGRPHVGFSNSAQPNYASLINARCTFTFTMSNRDTFIINIEPETGHAFVTGQADL